MSKRIHKYKIKICSDCNEMKEIRAKGMCHACYERLRRKKYKNRYRELDRKRDKTSKRIKWYAKYRKEYYKKNREKVLAYQVEYRKNNPDLIKKYWRAAYARRKNADGIITKEQWLAIVDFYCSDNNCIACGKEFDKFEITRKLSLDHVVPLSNGGTHWPSNIQPLCYSCNCSKKHHRQTDYRFDKGEFCMELMK